MPLLGANKLKPPALPGDTYLLAGLTHTIGVAIMLGACIWLYHHWHAQQLGED